MKKLINNPNTPLIINGIVIGSYTVLLINSNEYIKAIILYILAGISIIWFGRSIKNNK